MCYSKEVSLVAGSILMTGSGYCWIASRMRSVHEQVRKILRPFERDVIFGGFSVGIHQLCEFVALSTGNILVYKLGLIASILCMYFMIRSLEALTHISFGSRVVLLLIGLVGIHILLKDITFEGFLNIDKPF